MTAAKATGKAKKKKKAAGKKAAAAKTQKKAKPKAAKSKTKTTSTKKKARKKATTKGKKTVSKKTSAKKTTKKKATSASRSAGKATRSKAAASRPKAETGPKAKSRVPSSPERLERLRSMLEHKRHQLLERAAERSRVFEINAHGDLVDQSTDLSERELRMGMAEHDREMMQAIDEAMAKIETSEYGICDSCGVDIPEERLKAIPTASFCVPCKQRIEMEELAGEEQQKRYAETD